jgi:polygalacturonase
MRKEFNILDFGAVPDGQVLSTDAIQKAIDEASLCEGKVIVPAGIFLCGSLFLKQGIEFYLGEGSEIRGTTDESQYPYRLSRVAGIEMEWPAGLLNIFNQDNIHIVGPGTINGQGEFWWNKYWGEDKKGAMRKIYEEKGLRWAIDYDCARPRNFLIMNAKNIVLSEFTCKRSGFWNVHLCYSEHVHVDGLKIIENEGPSTDGIDIDSCNDVCVENCTISCNDDSVCVKAGRDADGLRVNRVCENITIRNCELLAGSGITLGSETSGGIRNVKVENIKYNGTHFGFRIKSAKNRGGVLEDISVKHLSMKNVRVAFSFMLNWHSKYSYCEIPEGYEGEIPKHWHTLLQKVSEEKGMPLVRNISISDVEVSYDESYEGITRAFEMEAYEGFPFENISFENTKLSVREFGKVSHMNGWKLNNVELDIK